VRKWLLRIGIVINVTVVVTAIWLYKFHGPGVLRAYASELHAKGEKLTFAEIFATYSTNVSDTVGILTDIVRSLGPVSSELTNARIGLVSSELTNISVLKFTAPGRVEVSFRQAVPPWASSVKGRQCTTWAGSSNRLFEADSELARLRETLRSPAPNGGFRDDWFHNVTPFPDIRQASYWLSFAALQDLHDGQKAEAVANLQALAGLANLHREEYLLVSQMTRVGVAQTSLATTWQALQANGWSDAQLAELQKAWEAVDLLDGLERGMEGERIFAMLIFERLKAERLQKSTGGKLYERYIAPNDIRFGLENRQKRVELVRRLQANEPWQNVSLALDKVDSELQQKYAMPKRFFYLLSLISIPNFRPAFVNTLQTEAKRRLAVTAISLMRYKLKYGRFPERLDALTISFVAAVPLDPMSGAPLRYRLNSDGSFMLYSVGEDGKDDGGDPQPIADASSRLTSVQANGWGGRDWVWPQPATNARSVLTSGAARVSATDGATMAR
jgi:hypothetical protein